MCTSIQIKGLLFPIGLTFSLPPWRNERERKCTTNIDHFHIEQFQHDLIHWFVKEQRDLPWRKEKDPYKIWVSEVMLQQTRVDTVIPYFYKFIEKFPTLDALADAEEKEVLKAWEGLGYYSRIRNLHAAVKEVKEKYNGCVPASKEQFSSLKGVDHIQRVRY